MKYLPLVLLLVPPQKPIEFQGGHLASPLWTISDGTIWLEEPVTGTMEITFRYHNEAYLANSNPNVACEAYFDSCVTFSIPELRLYDIHMDTPDATQILQQGFYETFSRGPAIEKTFRVHLDEPFQFAEWSYDYQTRSGSTCGAGIQAVFPRVTFTGKIIR